MMPATQTPRVCSPKCRTEQAWGPVHLPSQWRRTDVSPFRTGSSHSRLQQGNRGSHRCIVLAAKKGKKKGQLGGGGESVIPKAGNRPPYLDTDVIMQNLLLVESFRRKVGRPIMENQQISDLPRVLYEAPFPVLSHDETEERLFNYANQAALDLFECTWEEIIGLPSTKSAEDNPEVQEERLKLLQECEEKGFSAGFSAWRTTLKGKRFQIREAVLWNVDAPDDTRQGQAVMMTHWTYEDGTHGGPNAPVDEGELEPAEAAVTEQAEVVRQLKEGKGLTNADEEVKAAVAELLQRKEKVERIKRWIAESSMPVPAPAQAPAEPQAAEASSA